MAHNRAVDVVDTVDVVDAGQCKLYSKILTKFPISYIPQGNPCY